MKTFSKVFFFFVFIFLTIPLLCDDFSINIYYLHGEKSKDSHSSTEKITINNFDITYSVKYSGHNEKSNFEKEKSCTFTDKEINSIKETIIDKRINITDSIFSEGSKTKSFERFFNINIEFVLDDVKTIIKMNGDTDELEDTDLYKKSIILISL